MNEWYLKEMVDTYNKETSDPAICWYEFEVNFPELVKLLPSKINSLLDFGCASGTFTSKLLEYATAVTGVDIEPMIDVARTKYLNIKFSVWDGTVPIPHELETYDVIFSKLTLQFIENLQEVADNFYNLLNKTGALIISVPHPKTIAIKQDLDYDSVVTYQRKISNTDIIINPIHRSAEEYIRICTHSGFKLDTTSEPLIADHLIEKHSLASNCNDFPKRLNLKFVK